jgi:hypothetical protein
LFPFSEVKFKILPIFYLLRRHFKQGFNKNIILEIASSLLVAVDHDANALLDALAPLPFVDAAIDPLHCAPAISLVFRIVTSVLVAHCPLEAAFAML